MITEEMEIEKIKQKKKELETAVTAQLRKFIDEVGSCEVQLDIQYHFNQAGQVININTEAQIKI